MNGRRLRGFSLIELLVVIVIMAGVMTMVGVGFMRSIGAAEIRGASKEMISAMRYARGQSIIKREEMRFVVDVENKTYSAAGRPAKALPDDVEIRILTAQSELDDKSTGAIRFFPDGGSTGGRITLRHNDREWRIDVTWLTGEISLNRDEA